MKSLPGIPALAQVVLNAQSGGNHKMKKLVLALLSGAMLIPLAIAADKDSKKTPQHMDPYVNGTVDENRVAKAARFFCS